jgi:hypothetical protein
MKGIFVSVIFGLTEETEMELPYDKADDEFYTIRAITDDIRESWRKATFKGKVRLRDGSEEDRYDEKLRWRLMVDHVFAGWRGAIYLNAEDARAQRTSECHFDNKLLFAGTQTERMAWALEAAQSLGQRLAEKLEAQRKTFRGEDSVSSGESRAAV